MESLKSCGVRGGELSQSEDFFPLIIEDLKGLVYFLYHTKF